MSLSLYDVQRLILLLFVCSLVLYLVARRKP